MAQVLETSTMAVPMVPPLPADLPQELVTYLHDMKLYTDALSRDLQKLGALL